MERTARQVNWGLLLPTILILLILVIVIKPGLLGLGVQQTENEAKIESLKWNLTLAQANLSNQIGFQQMLKEELQELMRNLTACTVEKAMLIAELNTSITTREKTIIRLEGELEDKEKKFQELQTTQAEELRKKDEEYRQLNEQFNSSIPPLANNICCKQKVDNPRINFYSFTDGRVICTESGTTPLHCFS